MFDIKLAILQIQLENDLTSDKYWYTFPLENGKTIYIYFLFLIRIDILNFYISMYIEIFNSCFANLLEMLKSRFLCNTANNLYFSPPRNRWIKLYLSRHINWNWKFIFRKYYAIILGNWKNKIISEKLIFFSSYSCYKNR